MLSALHAFLALDIVDVPGRLGLLGGVMSGKKAIITTSHVEMSKNVVATNVRYVKDQKLSSDKSN